jgi:hypothetical protein
MATATNGYLLLIPREPLARYLREHPDFSLKILDFLNSIPDHDLVSNGRNYGGGLYKMEPKELSNINASFIAESIGFAQAPESEQLSLFSSVQEPPALILRSGAKGKERHEDNRKKGRRQDAKRTGAEGRRPMARTGAAAKLKHGRAFTNSTQQTHGGSRLKTALHPSARLDRVA